MIIENITVQLTADTLVITPQFNAGVGVTDYNQLENLPTLGTAAGENVEAFAPALTEDQNYVTDLQLADIIVIPDIIDTIEDLDLNKQDNIGIDAINGEPDKYLNKKGEWVEVITAGGAGGDVYLSNTPDPVISGYKKLSYEIDPSETVLSAVVNNNEVLMGVFLYCCEIKTTLIGGGAWNTHLWAKVSAVAGVSQIRAEYFLRKINGTEIILLSTTTQEINSLDYLEYSPNFSSPLIECELTDRLGVRMYAKTTHSANVTVSTIVGDGRGAHFSSPLSLRHEFLRDKNGELEFQHVDQEEKDKIAASFDFITDLTRATNHNNRVVGDLASPTTDLQNQITLLKFYESALADIRLLYCTHLTGNKLRESGAIRFVSKGYDYGRNKFDLIQSTAVNQFYLGGNIAPNEKQCIKIPTGLAAYLTYPQITYSGSDAWSITAVVNNFGSDNTSLNRDIICGKIGASEYIGLKLGASTTLRFISTGSVVNDFTSANAPDVYSFIINTIGKKAVWTFVATGSNFKIYGNGVLLADRNIATGFNLDSYLIASTANSANAFKGSSCFYKIQNGELTQPQVLTEANFLNSFSNEIESIQIGSITCATSNCEIGVNSIGAAITDGNLQATWSTNAAPYWCNHTNIDNASIYGKLYNKLARNLIIASPPAGWHVATKAELTTLSLLGGNSLKAVGVNYWNDSLGLNTSGLTILGGGSRSLAGVFSAIKATAQIWCADADEVMIINSSNNTVSFSGIEDGAGYSIRLIKN